jgi:uncharacterized membrane-anchored protein YitT (DUF2179 family)
MAISNKKIFNQIKSYLLIAFGLLINAFAWAAFLIPAKIVGGGVTGAAAIFFYLSDFPVWISFLAINSVLVVLGMRILGLKFAISSIFGIGVISLFFMILPTLITEPLITDRFMSALIGGALAGVGIGIAFVNGGNSGGTDIIALIITKYRNITPGRIILYLDVLIIASSYFINREIETVVFGYVVMAVFAYTLDLVIEGAKQSYQFIIVSKNKDEIAERIGNEIGRGITFLKAYGWYSKQESEVMMIMAHKHDKQKILQIIFECDKHAFISIAKVATVFGQNFDSIRY